MNPSFKCREVVTMDFDLDLGDHGGDYEFEVAEEAGDVLFKSGDYKIRARIEDLGAVVDHFKGKIGNPLAGIYRA